MRHTSYLSLLFACSFFACNDAPGTTTSSVAQGARLEGSIGVPACDSYLSQYTACVLSAVPSERQQQVLSGVARKKAQWQKLAESEFKKQALGRVCSAAIEAARVDLADWQCGWVNTSCGNGTIELGEECDDDSNDCSNCFAVEQGTGGSTGSGGGSPGPGNVAQCNSGNSTDLGAPGTTSNVQNDACLKVEGGYPGWWGSRQMNLQNESNGTVPLSFDWTNACAPASSSNAFSGEWQTLTLGNTSAECPTFIKLNGNGSGQTRIKYSSQ